MDFEYKLEKLLTAVNNKIEMNNGSVAKLNL